MALYAGDPELAERITHTLRLAGHKVVGRCRGLLELIEGLTLTDANLVVAVVEPIRGVAQLGLLRRELPGVPLIAVVPHVGAAEAGRLLAADIDGLVLVDELERALVPALESALADQLCVPSDALPVLAGPVFSHREKQVLRLLLAGLTNSDIAHELYLSESTVKSHLSSSFRKLGVSSRAEILRRAHASSELGLQLHLDREGTTPAPALA